LAAAADGFDVSAHYEKAEYRVPMRDGVELHTVVYRPMDRTRVYPILLNRTPYSSGPYGEKFRSTRDLAPGEEFLRAGYIFVFQDTRGTYRSGGEWVDFRPLRRDRKGIDESTDNFDTIEWLVRNVRRHNGRVGQWGISYPAWYTVMGLLEPHPALKAASPQATTADPFIGDDYHHNGAFMLVNLSFLEGMTIVTGPGREHLEAGPVESAIGYDHRWNYEFFLNAGPTSGIDAKYFGGRLFKGWDDLMAHPDYDEYWRQRDFLAPIGRVGVAVLNVAGWFDAPDPYGAIATYRRIEAKNPRKENTLVVGPWSHGGWHEGDGSRLGDMEFGAKTAGEYRRDVVFPFFEYHLKGTGHWTPAEAMVFETGGNRWHHLPQWPPAGAAPRNLYFKPGGHLSFDAPVESDAFDQYESVTSKPVPDSPSPPTGDFTIADQRYAFTRPDVLSYQTEPLEADVTIAGPIPIQLFASTSGSDSDWFVKLIDVHPEVAPGKRGMGGYQMLLAYEVMRGKYRNSFSKPEPMRPGEVTPIRFELRDRFHTFRKGHRIMVQVHSSWFPLFDRNPQVFTNIYTAEPGDYRDATQRVYRSAATPSHLELPVVNARTLSGPQADR
jgi:putative CocE/NonD family hydrolase